MPLSLVRAWAASGDAGKRWMRARSSRMPASFCFSAMQSLALVQVRGGNLVVVRELLEDAVVILRGGSVLAGAIVDLAEVVVGVSRERGVGVALDDVAELRRCDRVAWRPCSRRRRLCRGRRRRAWRLLRAGTGTGSACRWVRHGAEVDAVDEGGDCGWGWRRQGLRVRAWWRAEDSGGRRSSTAGCFRCW